MLYKAVWVDGSSEFVEADNISEAREQALELFDGCPLRNVQAVTEDEDAEDEFEELGDEEDDDSEEDESENPDANEEAEDGEEAE